MGQNQLEEIQSTDNRKPRGQLIISAPRGGNVLHLSQMMEKEQDLRQSVNVNINIHRELPPNYDQEPLLDNLETSRGSSPVNKK